MILIIYPILMYVFIYINTLLVMLMSRIPGTLERNNLSFKEALKCYLSFNLLDFDGTWEMDKGMMALAVTISPFIFVFILGVSIILGMVFLVTLPFKKVVEDENEKKRKKRGWIR